MTCPHVVDVAPYALGTLDPAERPQVAEHLRVCPECQEVLESVAGLPGLLARVHASDIETPAEPPDEAMFQRLLARSADVRPAPSADVRPAPPADVRSARRAPRRRLLLAAAAALVVVGGAGVAVHDGLQDSGTRVVSAAAGPVHATVRISPTPSGTAVRIDLSGVQAEEHCRLVAVDHAGHRTVAATWEAGYTGTATFAGSVSVPTDQLASLRVETDTATLLTFPLS